MEAVGREAQRVVETYDKAGEAAAIARDAQAAVAASAALEVGALGLGALIVALTTTLAWDVTGVLMSLGIAALGIFVIPARRRAAKSEMNEKVAMLRRQLTQTLRTQFEREIERSLRHIHDAIAPYTRFVRAERGKLTETQSEIENIRDQFNRIKGTIEKL